nr:MAG TPA: protein of unknown function (DUF4314) [Caudoviricetes sp.]
MNRFPSKEIVERLRRTYSKGTVVELVRMNDLHAPPAGTLGIVMSVDDIGTIHVRWNNGSGLGIAYGEDECKIVQNSK